MLAIVFARQPGGVTIVMIEHIMRAIMRFSERVVCLDAGQDPGGRRAGRDAADASVRRVYLGA